MKLLVAQFQENKRASRFVILSGAKDLSPDRDPSLCMSYQHRSHREELALPLEAYSPPAWWSTMYVNSSGHEVGNSYTPLEAAHGKSSLQMSTTRQAALT